MRNALLPFVLIFSFATCSESEKTANPFNQEWTLEEVYYDGVYQQGWEGLTMTMIAHGQNHGEYLFPDTPYDTIWQPSGSWRLGERSSTIIFNEDSNLQKTVEGVYSINESQFEFHVLLPWTQRPCTELPCVMIVLGNWDFKLRRKD